MDDNPILLQGDRQVVVIAEPELADHLASANPGHVEVGTDGSLDCDPAFYGILDDRIFSIGHGYLQGDVRFRVCLVDERDIAERDGRRQRSIGAYGKCPNGGDSWRKSRSGGPACRKSGRRRDIYRSSDRRGAQIDDLGGSVGNGGRDGSRCIGSGYDRRGERRRCRLGS